MDYRKRITEIVNAYGYIGDQAELLKKVYASGNSLHKEGISPEEFIYLNIEGYLKGLGLTAMRPVGSPVPRSYKDSAFCITYGRPDTAALLVSDILGEHYTADDVQIVTLKEYGVNSKHNDLGVQVNNKTVFLCEEQSSVCSNMPARMLIYYSYTLEQYIKSNNLRHAMYSATRVKLPAPKFYVIDITGKAPSSYSLSDSFNGDSSLNLDVTVISPNAGFKLQSLRPYYEVIQFIGDNVNRTDTDNVRKEFINFVNNLSCPSAIRNCISERSSDIMGFMQEEIDWDEVMRINIKESNIVAVANAFKAAGVAYEKSIECLCEQFGITKERAEDYLSDK